MSEDNNDPSHGQLSAARVHNLNTLKRTIGTLNGLAASLAQAVANHEAGGVDALPLSAAVKNVAYGTGSAAAELYTTVGALDVLAAAEVQS